MRGQALLVLALLCACTPQDSAADPDATAATPQVTLPMDGQSHVLAQRGTFVITLNTTFCITDPRIENVLMNQGLKGLPVPEIYKELRKRNMRNKITRECPNELDHIIIHQSLTMNRRGKPYRIEMSARQGSSAYFSVGVEGNGRSAADAGCPVQLDEMRPMGSPAPDPQTEAHEKEVCRIAASVRMDAVEMSSKLVSAIFSGKRN